MDLSEIKGFGLCYTIGQPPLAGTRTSGDYYLRQGFQQPKGKGCLLLSFDVASVRDECGTAYRFEYTSDLNPETEISWNFGEDASPTTSTEINPSGISYSSLGDKLITLTVRDGACTESVSKVIPVTQTGFGVFSEIDPITCHNEIGGGIMIEAFGGEGPYLYDWSNNSSSRDQTNLGPGNYTLTVTDINGCESINPFVLANPDSIEVSSRIIKEICAGTRDGGIELDVKGGTGTFRFQWNNGSINEDLTGLEAGTYAVTINDANDCGLDTSFVLAQVCTDNIVDYNTITPNGDGTNDIWVINGIERFPNNEVEIFNRWGVVVYRAEPYVNNWEGTTSGLKPLPSAGYYYVIRLNDTNDTVYSGPITIIR